MTSSRCGIPGNRVEFPVLVGLRPILMQVAFHCFQCGDYVVKVAHFTGRTSSRCGVTFSEELDMSRPLNKLWITVTILLLHYGQRH